MRGDYRIGLLALSLTCLMTVFAPVLAYGEGSEIDGFCKALLDKIHNPNARAVHIADLVAKNRSVGEKALPVLKEKAATQRHGASDYRSASIKLEEILLLTGTRLDCSDPVVKRLEEAAGRLVDKDDTVFYLSNLARLCPGNAERLVKLGNMYYELRQFGMAVATYRKALQIRDDPDTRKLLTEAQQYMAEYQKGKPVTVAEARDLVKPKPTTKLMGATGLMRPDGRIYAKVKPVAAIQTQICFDEWSCAIKDEFKQQLKAVGEGVSGQLRSSGKIGLLIEGHTDRRGPLDRNEQLSLDRAEAIKLWLVENYGLDSSRLRTVGFGPRRPFASTDDAAGWALNRRVEFKPIEDVGSYQ